MTAAQINRRVRQEGLTFSSYCVLSNVSVTPETVGSLRKLMRTSQPTITKMVQRLENLGLVRCERERVGKLRTEIFITGSGLELLGRIEPQ
jgi:DNA-binding MarR family transcriptional regulator